MPYISTVLANASSGQLSASEPTILARVLDWARQVSARRNTISALSDLSDRQLDDIGIERADLASFVDDHFESLRRY